MTPPGRGAADGADGVRRVATDGLLRRGLVRGSRGTEHVVTFLAVAALTVLVTRALLAATGYPQLGGDGLHVAHVLWGGLLMAVAFGLLLLFVGPAARPLASLVGGVGFGLFVDEVGKFVTSDNDYFYEPTPAIVYATIVGLGLLAEWVHGRRPRDPREHLAAAVDEAVAGVAGGFTPAARRRAERDLAAAGGVAGAHETAELLRSVEEDHAELPDPVGAVAGATAALLHRLVRAPFVPWVAVSVLVGSSVLSVARGIRVWDGQADLRLMAGGAVLSGLVSTTLAAVGLVRVRSDAVAGYRWFRRAVLVSLLVTQFFLFRLSQWDASWGLVVDLLVLGLVSVELASLRRADQHPRGVG